MELQVIEQQSYEAAKEIIEIAGLSKGDIFVVGCSSSEVLGEKIGTHTSMEAAEVIYAGITRALEERQINLAAQCCEHLNRALVVEKALMERYDFERVNAIPKPNHAGGAFASVAYLQMKEPVVVETIEARAAAGIDIGGTLIGMHIHPVVVPLRIKVQQIGEARIICARRRPKYIGGQRAVYEESLM